ncbi:MAG: (Fe-S)-binding protein [Alistipes sp.]|nr:(Fe-S)-binding protein [Candidatus Alistipes equi]
MDKHKIGLFIPCYVDKLYPEVGVACYRLLRSLGLEVFYPKEQTCCGQPMGNAGFERMSRPMAESFDSLFKDYDYVVAPGVSCVSYVRLHHPTLMDGHQCEAASKTYDIIEFLHDVVKVQSLKAKFPYRVSVHNSCHGVRELHLSSPSERNITQYNKIIDLLKMVEGIEIVEPEKKDECCGFGGMFSIEEPQISTRMGHDKIMRHMATKAQYITGPDSSCLMHMQGIAKKESLPIKFIHVVEILASGL